MTSVQDLREFANLSRAEVAARVEAALDEADRPATSEAESLQLDRAAVEALRLPHHVHALLGAFDLERLLKLLERCTARLRASSDPRETTLRTLVWDVLDLIRRPEVLRRIEGAATETWAQHILAAVEASHLTVGPLFRHRAATYGSKVLFELPEAGVSRSLTWHEVAARVETLARALLALSGQSPRVAIISENRIESALLDLACLTSGIVNVMVPANATEADVGFILRHSKADTVIVSGPDQLQKVQKNRESLPELKHLVIIDPLPDQDVLTLQAVEARASEISRSHVRERSEAISIDDLATVMYTSGTTGTPKGIQFSHRNLVFKRFARALALPAIGEQDVFVAYLPLFHTFGRFLEMLGCVCWGAKYCFLLNPSVDALTEAMGRHRPTVFISVPKKWMQLYGSISQRAHPVEASDQELLEATREVTGGRLRWGLSAAGYLDPDIFRFFHRQGIDLLSGFGMTEATGGITMTPPGQYKPNSVGKALPGIDVGLAKDGELLVRGPYMMMGYLDPIDGSPSFDEDGWFHSGDLARMDDDGHIQLVDRKKEIYKNVSGETIAPQRIENLFREFESVGRAFLVGDHQEYNTLLIYPNPTYKELDFSTLSPRQVREHFRSLVVSVNEFVAPFERIVDFAVIERDLDSERGELTPKGTPRRKVVADHFADVIDSLYRRVNLHVAGVDVAFPNWLFQTLGLTTEDVRVHPSQITLPSLGSALTVRRLSETRVQVGSCCYHCTSETLNLGALLATPRLWLGNEELVGFASLDIAARQRPRWGREAVQWGGRLEPYEPTEADHRALAQITTHAEWDLMDLDQAARMLSSADEDAALNAIRLLERVLGNEEGPLAEPARELLARAAHVAAVEVRRQAFQVLVPAEKVSRFRDTVEYFLRHDSHLFDADTSEFLCKRRLHEAKVETLITFAQEAYTRGSRNRDSRRLARALVRFLCKYGAAHPIRYRRIRAFLVRMSLFAADNALRERAANARITLEDGFHQWLGPTYKIAVDPETGQEYRWDDVVVFEEGTPEDHRRRLLSAIKGTAFLREAVFLFYRGTMIRLTDIPPGGVWIRLLGSRHGKVVYRVTIQTRQQDSYDVAANINESLTEEQVEEEIDWLILCGDGGSSEQVVESFGGYMPDQGLWSEEFVAGDTLDREMQRLARRSEPEEGLMQLWPFLAWSALSAYVGFWQRAGKRCEIADLSSANIVLPTHDYHTGSRIVSLTARRAHRGLLAMIRSFREEFIESVEGEYPRLKGMVGWNVILSSVLEVIGEHEGLRAYQQALETELDVSDELRTAAENYIPTVRQRGFLPMRLYFAAKRYRRWAELNEDATPQARARTLQEFYDTYGLDRLAQSYPEVRLRFFRETVFRDSSPELADGLDELIGRVRTGKMRNGELAGAVAELRRQLTVEPDDDYFLARIPFAHLRPEDTVDFVTSDVGGSYQSEIVVALEDTDGRSFRVRHALLPKEVERLHRLFLAAKLEVRFRPEHRYLVAISDREQIIGGIYYTVEEGGTRAHLEKIVVADAYRRKGVADGIMREFFNRLRAAGARAVTTGFFRPEYFYAHGFKIEKRYAGLVKSLE